MFLYNEKEGGVNDGKAIRKSAERKKTNWDYLCEKG